MFAYKREGLLYRPLLISAYCILVFCLSGCDTTDNESSVLFEDSFEAATCLDNWVIGGRQAEGANIADCAVQRESTRGHLFKTSITEVTLAPEMEQFPFSRELTFNFDLELRSFSTEGAPSNFYGSTGVGFDFLSADLQPLGSVSYMSATTPFPFESMADDSTMHAVEVAEDRVHSFSLTAEELLSHVSIDESAIAYVSMRLWAYSSTRPFPTIEAELWIDNVRITE